MKNIIISNGTLRNGEIETELMPKEIFNQVMNGPAMVIKNIFPVEEARKLKQLAFEWGKSQIVLSAEKFYSQARYNNFCIQRGISKIQKTLHYYCSYNFNTPEDIENVELKNQLLKFIHPLKKFYNNVTGNEADFIGEKILHPQIIHYPSGGGFFARHIHILEPQRIGLIISLSKNNEDFNEGGTGFEINNEAVSIEPYHDAGDIGLFRFDLYHWVSPIDIEQSMNLNSSRGRWTLVLPYY